MQANVNPLKRYNWRGQVFNQKQLDNTQSLSFLLGTGTLLREKYSLDVGKYTTLSNSHPGEQLVQLFIIPDKRTDLTQT